MFPRNERARRAPLWGLAALLSLLALAASADDINAGSGNAINEGVSSGTAGANPLNSGIRSTTGGAAAVNGFLLRETGSFMLRESGDKLCLEGKVGC